LLSDAFIGEATLTEVAELGKDKLAEELVTSEVAEELVALCTWSGGLDRGRFWRAGGRM